MPNEEDTSFIRPEKINIFKIRILFEDTLTLQDQPKLFRLERQKTRINREEI